MGNSKETFFASLLPICEVSASFPCRPKAPKSPLRQRTKKISSSFLYPPHEFLHLIDAVQHYEKAYDTQNEKMRGITPLEVPT